MFVIYTDPKSWEGILHRVKWFQNGHVDRDTDRAPFCVALVCKPGHNEEIEVEDIHVVEPEEPRGGRCPKCFP